MNLTVKLDLTSAYNNFFNKYSPFTQIDHPDGYGMVAFRNNDGKYLSYTPEGNPNALADNPGSWERFVPYGNMAIHQQSQLVLPLFAGTIPDIP